MKNVKVANVLDDNFKVILNVGQNDGIHIGQRFLIYALSDHEILDPDTKESLGFLEIIKGSGKVVHLQATMCTVESDKYESIPVKKIFRKSSAFALMEEPVEETTITKSLLPFNDPQIGDLAKQV